MIFLCCWCVKRKRLADQEYKTITPDENFSNGTTPYEPPRNRFQQSHEVDTLPRKTDSMSSFDGKKYGGR